MIPVLPSPQYGTAEFCIVSAPALPLPPNHILLYCLCPCGAHRTHFTMDRDVLLSYMMRNQPIDIRGPPHLQGLPQMRLRLRLGRAANRKEDDEMIPFNGAQEDVDR